MKITFLLPEADLSGGVRVVAIYAQRLKDRGHEVLVVSTPPRPPSLREALRRVKRGEWSRRSSGPSHLDGVDVGHKVLAQYRPVEAHDIPDGDVVVATWWETAEWAARLPAHKGAKVYLIQHDERAMYPAPEAAPQRERVMATWRLPMQRLVVAQWLKELLESRLGPGAARVVPNGVDLARFHAPDRGKQPAVTIGAMYATVRFKGWDIARAACEIASRRVPGVRMVSFGSEAVAPHLPLPAGMHFERAPRQERIREIYASCDAWLFSSRYEGFGLPVLEAMACGTPVIAAPAGAAPELVGAGGGIPVPPEDPEAMARAIETIATMSDERWREMSASARRTASRHDWEHATDLLEAALREAAEGEDAGTSAGRSGHGWKEESVRA